MNHSPGTWMRIGLLGLILLTGCYDPFAELCVTPPSQSTPKPVIQPAPILKEEKSAEPPPKPKAQPLEVVATEKPAQPKVLQLDPDIVTVTPTWAKGKSEPKLQRVQAAEVAPPKPIPARIELSQIPVTSPVGQFIVAVAKLTDLDGEPVTDAELEWNVDRAGVGEILAAGGFDEADQQASPHSVLSYRSRTSATRHDLSLVMESGDPLTIHPGESWCVLRSFAPGDMVVSARSEQIMPVERREVSHRIHWHEALLDLEREVVVPGGEAASLVARIANGHGQPLIGYSVRFDVIGERASISDGRAGTERTSDSAGLALANVVPAFDDGGETQVRVQLYGRPVMPGVPTLLDERTVDVRWTSASKPRLSVHGPEIAPVGTTVTLTADISDDMQGEPSSRIVALIGPGVDIVSTLPEHAEELGVQFALAELGPARPSGETVLTVTSREPGVRRVRFEIRSKDKVQVSREALVRFVEPTITVEKQFPEKWLVGEPQTYTVVVRNIGEIPAYAIDVDDEIPPGLKIEKTEGVRYVDQIRWKVAKLEVGQAADFQVLATPQKEFDSLAVRAKASGSTAPLVETYDLLVAKGIDTVEVSIDDMVDPVPVDGRAEYFIEVANRGTAPATDVRLQTTISGNLKILSAEGPLAARIEAGRLQFDPIALLNPGERLYCRVRAIAQQPGEARINVEVQHDSVGPIGLVEQESTHIYQP